MSAKDSAWVIGLCWRCEATDVPVLWIGPIQSAEAGEAPFTCCTRCIRRLEALIHLHTTRGFEAASA
ncbi:hypothetical protein HGA06_08895 [Streptomyces somaliensis DSM 40738]|uniref:Uncharacterized protein n=1 Tax=Streptomyces somaliensis (strain ATCC 33201 / DSM 40738 / JCM 12659 / KCTC 9044 / NCTC 11332 / NRRL B-12077 / IP 733) TaxID=1134445 RepID=A0AA44DDK0_STRE0|nr:hypothetical protein [Streptomyces somaliensis DSM 40738]